MTPRATGHGLESLKPTDAYCETWRAYHDARRKWLRGMIRGAAGMFVYVVALLLANGNAPAEYVGMGAITGFVLILMVILPALSAQSRIARTSCPRCGELFHERRGKGLAVSERCVYCGLALYAPDDPDKETT